MHHTHARAHTSSLSDTLRREMNGCHSGPGAWVVSLSNGRRASAPTSLYWKSASAWADLFQGPSGPGEQCILLSQ